MIELLLKPVLPIIILLSFGIHAIVWTLIDSYVLAAICTKLPGFYGTSRR
jgi:hypothetical protein